MMCKRLIFILLILMLLPAPTFAKKQREMTITIATSPYSSLTTTISLKGAGDLAERILSCKTAATRQMPELPRATIGIGKRVYVYDSLDRLFEPKRSRKVLLSSQAQRELEQLIAVAERSHYGQPLPWDQVRQEFKRMAYASVKDLETGESFRIQRRAGSRHADVQPLTRADTETLKRIYQGKWSWRRRAILVEVNGRQYAASMHGMPHGSGSIAGNGFPGHFCIHFQGSSTHRRREPDPSHSFMILKASGRLQQAILQAEPDQLLDYYLISLHQRDLGAMEMMTEKTDLPFRVEDISSFHWSVGEKAESDGLLAAEIPVKVEYLERKEGIRKQEWVFVLTRSSPLERWKITQIDYGNN